jgi:hypothetical protein
LEQRDQKKELTWKSAKSPPNFKLSIKVDPNKITLSELKKETTSTCSIALSGIDKTILKAGKKGIPPIDWKAFIPND